MFVSGSLSSSAVLLAVLGKSCISPTAFAAETTSLRPLLSIVMIAFRRYARSWSGQATARKKLSYASTFDILLASNATGGAPFSLDCWDSTGWRMRGTSGRFNECSLTAARPAARQRSGRFLAEVPRVFQAFVGGTGDKHAERYGTGSGSDRLRAEASCPPSPVGSHLTVRARSTALQPEQERDLNPRQVRQISGHP